MQDKITVTSAGGVEVDYEIAGLGGRSFAFIIDWHIRIVVVLAWFAGLTYLFFQTLDAAVIFTESEGSQRTRLYVFVVVIPGVLFYLLYHPILELIMQGRTPGKRMAGVRIISKNGHSASAGAILIRNVFRLVDSFPGGLYVLGVLVALFNRRNLRLGDLAAGTVLIYEEQASNKSIDKLISGHTSDVSMQQRELAIELYERWRQLQRETRIVLATQLLTRLGRTLPDSAKPRELDRQLYAELQRLVQGN